jgi:hypothetical protein
MSTARRWSVVAGVAAVIMTLLGSGCSTIPLDEQAHGVDDVPDGFLQTTVSAPAETAPPDETTHVLVLYFVNSENNLVRVERPREETMTLQEAISALTAPPLETELEANPGITTTLLAGLEPTTGAITDSGVLPIQVSGGELRLSSTETPDRVRFIYSQIVCTAVANKSSILAVQINDDEGAIRVQGQDGAVIDGPVTPADLNDCKTAEQIAAETLEATDGEGTTTTTEGG